MVQPLGTVTVGFNEVKVAFHPELEEQGTFSLEGNEYTIRLHKLPDTRLGSQVLLHEILHAIDDAYGLRLGERGVRTMEQALACFIRDNPETTASLVQHLSS